MEKAKNFKRGFGFFFRVLSKMENVFVSIFVACIEKHIFFDHWERSFYRSNVVQRMLPPKSFTFEKCLL
ncbi:hypothetical protein CPK_ORF00297 [Chlamydia pneumoniae LPCoLN]|nr:hypothetical protein CPK_ORF00297 [Chlamydia pneumoniae LPCoLN]ETR79649.1 hypothetical protein X556_1023 [Chlamydia pneumoniae B21]